MFGLLFQWCFVDGCEVVPISSKRWVWPFHHIIAVMICCLVVLVLDVSNVLWEQCEVFCKILIFIPVFLTWWVPLESHWYCSSLLWGGISIPTGWYWNFCIFIGVYFSCAFGYLFVIWLDNGDIYLIGCIIFKPLIYIYIYIYLRGATGLFYMLSLSLRLLVRGVSRFPGFLSYSWFLRQNPCFLRRYPMIPGVLHTVPHVVRCWDAGS